MAALTSQRPPITNVSNLRRVERLGRKVHLSQPTLPKKKKLLYVPSTIHPQLCLSVFSVDGYCLVLCEKLSCLSTSKLIKFLKVTRHGGWGPFNQTQEEPFSLRRKNLNMQQQHCGFVFEEQCQEKHDDREAIVCENLRLQNVFCSNEKESRCFHIFRFRKRF